jgi:hypothetical protein
LQQRLGDGEDALADKELALPQSQLLDFLHEGTLSHVLTPRTTVSSIGSSGSPAGVPPRLSAAALPVLPALARLRTLNRP